MGNCLNKSFRDNYSTDNCKQTNARELRSAAVDRMLAICDGETPSSSDEMDHLLKQYPSAARTRIRCEAQYDMWDDMIFNVDGGNRGMIEPLQGELSRFPEREPTRKYWHETNRVRMSYTYPLHVACENNAPISVIRALIKAWPDVVKKIANTRLPLHKACSCGQSLPTIQLLVEAWPESTQCTTSDSDCYLPLHLALMKSMVSLDIIRFLVQQWPESLQKEHDSWDGRRDALKIALESGQNDDIIQYLVQQCPEAIKKCDENGTLPMYWGLRSKLSSEYFHLLTNGVPPLHFICQYSRTPWIPTRMTEIKNAASICPNDDDPMHFYYQGMLPFHWACRSRAPRSVLEWWSEQYPAIASARTTHTNELPLHCYLASRSTEGRETITNDHRDDECYLSAVQFLVEQHPDALTCFNRMGWLPFHVAALHSASLDIIFYLICQNPLALLARSQLLSSSEIT